MFREKGNKLLVRNSFTNGLWESWKAALSVGDKASVTNLFLVIYKNRNYFFIALEIGIFLQPLRQPDSTLWMFKHLEQHIYTPDETHPCCTFKMSFWWIATCKTNRSSYCPLCRMCSSKGGFPQPVVLRACLRHRVLQASPRRHGRYSSHGARRP